MVYISYVLTSIICVNFLWHLWTNLQEDLGTEYLVRPVARAEDEEDASDFELEENGGEEEEIDKEDEDEDGGKVDVPTKRKRSDKNDSDDDDDSGEDDVLATLMFRQWKCLVFLDFFFVLNSELKKKKKRCKMVLTTNTNSHVTEFCIDKNWKLEDWIDKIES